MKGSSRSSVRSFRCRRSKNNAPKIISRRDEACPVSAQAPEFQFEEPSGGGAAARDAASHVFTGNNAYRPLNLPPVRRYSKHALAVSRPSYPSPAICPNSCSVCPTKGGLGMRPTICGVLLLDPSPYSPLELVKSMGDVSGFRGRHQIMRVSDQRGTLGVNR